LSSDAKVTTAPKVANKAKVAAKKGKKAKGTAKAKPAKTAQRGNPPRLAASSPQRATAAKKPKSYFQWNGYVTWKIVI
jgi:hypothetical protein